MPRWRSGGRWPAAALAGLLALAACQPGVGPTVDPLPDHGVGVRYEPSVAELAAYEDWLGRPVDTALFYFHGDDYATQVRHAQWLLPRFAGSKYANLVFSLSIVLPGQTLGEVSQGANDRLFRALARELVANGRGDDIIRPGWEFNGIWFDWSAVGRWKLYARTYRRVVEVMRSVPGAEHLRFEWNVARGGEPVPDEAYPGDDVVDIIGMDIYDGSSNAANADPVVRWDQYVNGTPGLTWLRTFATAHGKPMAFSEWGLSSRHTKGSDPDNPYFIEQMHAWIQANDVAYSIYFEDDTPVVDYRLMLHFPRAAARYRELFGGG